MGPIEDDIIHSYTYEFDESKRLSTDIGPLEFARTKELLQRFLPAAPAVVLDVGGAVGPYSFWLASLGYRVHLLDIVPAHIAKARLAQARPECGKLEGIHLGDARHLPFEDGVADAVMIHGPLYHLPDRADRLGCLREGKRVLKPNCRLLAFGITRYAGLLYTISKGTIFDAQTRNMIETEVQTGRRLRSPTDRTCFKSAYFHLPKEMEAEVGEAGFEVEGTYGVLGPAWQVPELEESWNDPEKREVLLGLARLTEGEPVLGPRFMTVGVNRSMLKGLG